MRLVECLAISLLIILPAVINSSASVVAYPLAAVMAKVRNTYPAVGHLAPEEFLALSSRSAKDIIVIDVREEMEYAVSHLPSALQVSPGISSSQFVRTFGPELAGKTVVVYCSVGVRSSRLADRIAREAAKAGALGVYNLEGGIFRWHNEGRPLVSRTTPTEKIHAYNRTWARYITRQKRAVF